MRDLVEYVQVHTVRGACTCGKCVDAPESPEGHQPDGHTVDMFFFKVAAQNEPDADELRRLIATHAGEFGDCDLLDGGEHSYIEVGGFVGDQGLALCLMGLGRLLGLWETMIPSDIPGIGGEVASLMAEQGLVVIRANEENRRKVRELVGARTNSPRDLMPTEAAPSDGNSAGKERTEPA